MAKVNQGYFPIKYNKLSVAEPGGEENWIDLTQELFTGFTISKDGTTDEFQELGKAGQTTVKLSRTISIDATAKRCVGAAGQKLIIKKSEGILSEAHIKVKAELADGTTYEFLANVDVTDIGTGDDGSKLAEFKCSFTMADGEYKYTAEK